MFYREPIVKTIQIEDERPFLSFTMLINVIKEHKLTFCISLLHLPQIFLGSYIYFTFSDAPCNNNPFILVYFRISGTYHILLFVIYFFIILLSDKYKYNWNILNEGKCNLSNMYVSCAPHHHLLPWFNKYFVKSMHTNITSLHSLNYHLLVSLWYFLFLTEFWTWETLILLLRLTKIIL